MKLIPQDIDGLYEVQLARQSDARGAFARTFCADVFAQAGLLTNWVQMNMSQTKGQGTLRGLHFQRAPMAEAKLIRATEGKVFDLALDLREGSPTFGQSRAITLCAEAGNAIYIPEGCAHGFQTLTETATLHYCHTAPYTPELEGGVRATDPDLGIDWPLPITLMSERDQNLPALLDVRPL
ncbi:dTDP-4-dehydrorhamnose 3,5-epimerase [Ruegeria sp. SCSIO 43209]|uniref:dTDP-4-dehydrorhamnose 3,5-epimerase n=1 Tax=Ruegeria sp. SCSIO 43209 TaxID=2793010 RepID=UPI00147A167E|nr:dTDP-4-dehydrorhamnose 3,5-epimerase [Ruegeria sp. SCSIO 43209]UAB89837.1 dTDP-4-dehydrorhamnose 3,5-epimerase [Ruegeria sp. SCSIO 43209]